MEKSCFTGQEAEKDIRTQEIVAHRTVLNLIAKFGPIEHFGRVKCPTYQTHIQKSVSFSIGMFIV